jgi:hypothetical protein
MAKFVSCTELYEIIQKKSSQAKDILWVFSPHLSSGAHQVFSQEILKDLPLDIRFVFGLNDLAVRKGEVNPYEIQYLLEHFKGCCVKSHEISNLSIYIFDNSALITSANLTITAFENNIEIGVLLDDLEVDKIKSFFNQSLWQKGKPVNDLKKAKNIWNMSQKKIAKSLNSKKNKQHTKINSWTNEYFGSWYIAVPNKISAKTEHKIKKETNWASELLIVGDIGYNTFKRLRLGDFTYLVNLYKKRGNIEIELARVFDKSKVETDEGDLHLACQLIKKYLLERQQFFDLIKNTNIQRTSEMILDEDQLKVIVDTFSRIKIKRKRKSKSNLVRTAL